MRTNDEIYNIVMDRKDEFEVRRSARNKRIGAISAAAVAIAICVTAGVAAQRGTITSKKAEGGANSEATYPEISVYEEEQTAVSYANDESEIITEAMSGYNGKEEPTTQKIYGGAIVLPDEATVPDEHGSETTTAVPHDEGSGGTYGGEYGACIPVVPAATGAKPGVKISGEKITDAEAKKYFEENTWIVSSLSSSGVPADNLKFSEKGYCHVSYDGTEGKQLELKQNFRDYLVYNNGKLVAIVTLTKENGKLSASPAFGGPHFDEFNAFLQKHKGEELLFVYAGWMEIVITPDGECVNPQGYDISKDYGLDSLGVNPYSYFYCDAATYTP